MSGMLDKQAGHTDNVSIMVTFRTIGYLYIRTSIRTLLFAHHCAQHFMPSFECDSALSLCHYDTMVLSNEIFIAVACLLVMQLELLILKVSQSLWFVRVKGHWSYEFIPHSQAHC